MNFIKSLWHGEQGLAFTFWVMGAGVLFILTMALLFSIDASSDYEPIVSWTIWFFIALYLAFILVATWKSAGKYISAARAKRAKGFFWHLARGVVIIGWLNVFNMLFWLYVAIGHV